VLLPASNACHLMLRQDVVDAVRAGRFNVWPVHTVDEALTLLTGVDAGEMDAEGQWTDADSVNGRVATGLARLAQVRQAFLHPKDTAKAPDKAAEKEIREVLNEQQGILEWRCMDRSVYACVWFNGPICSKRDGLHDEDIERHCQRVVNEPSVPGYITGHSDPSISWSCKHGKAVITGGDFRTDKRGYPVEVWTRIIPGVRIK